MDNVKAIVLRAAGINCDKETEYALTLAGADTERIHINQIIENQSVLDGFHIMVFAGGFSYGDDVAAGKILANQTIHHLAEAIRKFIDDGKLVLGICNGFQVLTKTGILPGEDSATPAYQKDVTITCNDSGIFEDRWVYLAPQTKRCVFIDADKQIYMPIAHGEGKVVTKDDDILQAIIDNDHIAFKYVDKDGNEGEYPINPNGSIASIAGLTDTTGRVLGLMPHPERHIQNTQHPRWTRRKSQSANLESQIPDGITIFENAVNYIKKHF